MSSSFSSDSPAHTCTMEPTAKDAIIITNSVIDKLNDEIVRLGEAKMMAMQESKEYRKGSLHLRCDQPKLIFMNDGDFKCKIYDTEK